MFLTREQLAELQSIIDERRRALAAELRQDAARTREETFGSVIGPVMDTGDEAVADLISDLDNAELSRDLREIRELEAARARISQGTFGRCIDCEGDIDFERLRAWPAAVRCIRCQAVHEKTYAHPSEPKL